MYPTQSNYCYIHQVTSQPTIVINLTYVINVRCNIMLTNINPKKLKPFDIFPIKMFVLLFDPENRKIIKLEVCQN